jgi:hypothetical protein
MRLKYVYLLKDGNGKVVDVGQSYDPSSRLVHKTRSKPKPGRRTNFYGRTDITQEVVSSWQTNKEARAEEGRLKLHYGLEWTERTGALKGSLIASSKKRKLTKEQADEIRAKYIPYKYPPSKLSEEYGICSAAIYRILNNITYKQ